MPKSHAQYAAEYRRRMIELVRAGRRPEELAKEFEPSAQSIRNWVRQADLDKGRRHDGLTSVASITSAPSWRSTSTNRGCRASSMDGTASLANRDFGRVLPLNRRKLLSPVPRGMQNKPHARAIPPIRGMNPQRRDSVAERGGFEPPVPRGLIWAKFSPSLAHYSAEKSIRIGDLR